MFKPVVTSVTFEFASATPGATHSHHTPAP